MSQRLVAAILALNLLFLAGPSFAQERWSLLGAQATTSQAGDISIDTSAAKGASRAVRLVGRGGTATVSSVVVAYSDGRSLEETREIKLAPGERTRSIAPLEEDRFIDRVDVTFQTAGDASTTFEVWGLQTVAGAAMVRPAGAKGDLEALMEQATKHLDLTSKQKMAAFEASNRSRTVLIGEHAALAGAPGNANLSNSLRSGIASLQVRVADADLYVEDVTLVRSDGNRETLPINAEIKAGRQTDWLPLKAPGTITSVMLNYRRPGSGVKARVAVYAELMKASLVTVSGPGSSPTVPESYSTVYKPTSVAPPAMPSCEDATSQICTAIHIHFGTNRVRADKGKQIGFGASPDNRPWYGIAKVTVPRAHKKGGYEQPGWWRKWLSPFPSFGVWPYDPAKHIGIPGGGIRVLGLDEFISSMQEAMNAKVDFKGHVFVYVHGFAVPFEDALMRTAQITYDLGTRRSDGWVPYGVPFVFSWPSNGEVEATAYNSDRERAEGASRAFAEFLDLVVEKSGAAKIHIIAHSMGNEALRQMLETTTPLGQKIDQLVMAAPDVDRRNFIDSMLGRARQFAKAITLYASSNDAAMIASRRFHHGDPRAGDVPTELGPVTSPTPSSSGATEFEQEPRFYPIDVSSISLGIFSFRAHSAYAASRELLCDMRQLFQSDQKTVPPPDQRKPPVTEVATDGGRQRYWVYVKSPDLDTYCPESF